MVHKLNLSSNHHFSTSEPKIKKSPMLGKSPVVIKPKAPKFKLPDLTTTLELPKTPEFGITPKSTFNLKKKI